MTLLPKRTEELVKTYIPEKRRNLARILMFGLFLCMLAAFRPAFAGVGTFFGYISDDRDEIYAEILSGEAAHDTLDMCFSEEVITEVNSMEAVSKLMKFTAAIGIILIMIHVTLSIIDALQNGFMTSEKLTGLLITFALPALLIINFSSLSDKISTAGTATKDGIVKNLEEEDNGLTYTQQDVDEMVQDYEEAYKELKSEMDNYKQQHQDESETSTKIAQKINTEIEEGKRFYDGLKETAPGYLGQNKVYVHVHRITKGENLFSYKNKGLISRWKKTMQTSADEDWSIGETTIEIFKDIGKFLGGSIGTGANKLFNSMGDFVLCLLLICTDIGIRIGIMIACYGVLGRLIIYKIFLPMSIADIGKEGTRSNGMRMIKLYFAVYLEIGMYYLINVVGWKIFGILVLQQETVAGLIVCFIGAGAGIRALMKGAKHISERIVGVNG